MGGDIKLRDIFIGKSDGLSESNRDDFMKLFYKGNGSYHALITDDSKFIISGRKGTGKTILAKYYEKEQVNSGMIAKFLNANDILLSQLKEIEGENIEKYQISAFVKYVILYEMAKLVIEKDKVIIGNTKCIKRFQIKKLIKELKIFLEERNCSSNYKIKEFSKECLEERTLSITSNVSGKKASLIGAIGGKVHNKKNQYYEKNPYYLITDKIENFVIHIIENTSISLIFDDLDEYAEKISDNMGFQQLLLKLLQVSNELNNKFRVYNKNKSKVLVLIRSDILENLQTKSSNLNKVLADCQIRINWMANENSPEDNELIDLILTKIKNSSEKLKELDKKEVFELFFPKEVGNQSTVKFLINSGHGRPRDIIDMLNIIKKKNGEATCFTAQMFQNAAKEYSKNFKDSLKNEMSLYYSSDKINECFYLITLMKQSVFTIDDVVETLEAYETKLNHLESGMEFVDISYQFGLIGNRIKHEGKMYTFFKYREDGHDLADYRAKFIVHNGLKKSIL